jgi:hypothetical protein
VNILRIYMSTLRMIFQWKVKTISHPSHQVSRILRLGYLSKNYFLPINTLFKNHLGYSTKFKKESIEQYQFPNGTYWSK